MPKSTVKVILFAVVIVLFVPFSAWMLLRHDTVPEKVGPEKVGIDAAPIYLADGVELVLIKGTEPLISFQSGSGEVYRDLHASQHEGGLRITGRRGTKKTVEILAMSDGSTKVVEGNTPTTSHTAELPFDRVADWLAAHPRASVVSVPTPSPPPSPK